MSEYATKGAQLKCSCGGAPSILSVSSNTSFMVQNNAVATTADKAPFINIKPFGPCSLRMGYPCIPAPLIWTGFLNSVELSAGNPLLQTSKIHCAMGGCISFVNSGQMQANKVITDPTSIQIETLRKAAQSGSPFVEICEKKEKVLKPKITKIYWVDENKEEWDIDTLYPHQTVTLCIDVAGVDSGKTVDVKFITDDGKLFRGGKKELNFTPVVEVDGTAYIDSFTIEYEN